MHLMQSDYIEYQWHFTAYSRRNKGLIVVNGTGSFLFLSFSLPLALSRYITPRNFNHRGATMKTWWIGVFRSPKEGNSSRNRPSVSVVRRGLECPTGNSGRCGGLVRLYRQRLREAQHPRDACFYLFARIASTLEADDDDGAKGKRGDCTLRCRPWGYRREGNALFCI